MRRTLTIQFVAENATGGFNMAEIILSADFVKKIKQSAVYKAYLSRLSDQIIEDAQKEAPVDTGHLRDSFEKKITDDALVIWNSAEYFEYVEYGTSKQAAQPSLRPAMLKAISRGQIKK